MRIYISADLEGATGVVNADQTDSKKPEYAFGCKMQLHDVNAVIDGLVEGGATEILVNDSHHGMTNLDLSGLNPRAHLLSGTPKLNGMMEGCESADAVIFLCYHAMAGTRDAVLDHTISGGKVFSINLNDNEIGETGLNAAVAAHYGVPVAMLSGDRAVCNEAKNLLGYNLITACVKEGHGRSAAECISASDSEKLLFASAQEALNRVRAGRAPVLNIGDGSFDLKITFMNSRLCDRAAIIPGVQRLNGRTVRICGDNMLDMRRWANALIY